MKPKQLREVDEREKDGEQWKSERKKKSWKTDLDALEDGKGVGKKRKEGKSVKREERRVK